ncbi:amylo-alpha-1,6-glucosidase [Aminobacter sp. MET-1]|uniref:amylo-alpha-1,6-glucosidase n=1 Tax=Aminobacter sp. MET-1 TaxID=2951085 RepID=UPI00226AA144|nr:amylo-alpha-1,6-glucosidase [Aminobacter sp. MET-1]MCX8572053.1 amylo-alpha-1,6-glucosidase [Aminobacter sp. MET-1]
MAQLDERHLDPAVALATLDDTPPRAPHRQFALKDGDCFVVTNDRGDIQGRGDGFFRDDTRVLSLFRLTVAGREPSLLGASLSQDNIVFTANLTNMPMDHVSQGVIHIERSRLLWQDRMYERIRLWNYGDRDMQMPLSLEFDADFRDMFEVRGSTRSKRGKTFASETSAGHVLLKYQGLDTLVRQSVIAFSEQPIQLSAGSAEFRISLPRHDGFSLFIEVGASMVERPSRERYRSAAAHARWRTRAKRRHGATLHSSGRVFNDWMSRARADIALLTTELPTGPYPYAGIPWFSTAFGRDGVISALQMLWLNPGLAKGVLAFLAQHQATETLAFSDSQPGKIMHETRKGEMAVLRELPFGRYYGGVDTTPLYIYLASAYAKRTGDMAFIEQLWPSLRAAAGWMDAMQAQHPKGLVAYKRASETGLSNQGWKDSSDAIFHADGSIPKGPIALVEVQGYVFAAYRGLAQLAARRGESDLAKNWDDNAERMRASVERVFWMEDRGYYAIAIDGEGHPCKVRASNAGHLLYVGLPSKDRARQLSETLQTAAFQTGWGVRTLADDEIPFNPMSYHNGSIWPHDTAICGAGMAQYGERDSVVRLMSGTFESAVHFNMRLPELFCGFTRSPGEAPVAYPVACLPQAWSSGSAFMLMQACLGLEVDGFESEIRVSRPRLPIGIDTLTIRRLRVGNVEVDVHFQRVGDRVACFLDARDEGRAPLVVRS